jgi:hypothetical protein
MTDEATALPEPAEDAWGGWTEAEGGTEIPSVPQGTAVAVSKQLTDHKYVLSIAPDKAPFLVIRAESAQELNQAFTELEMNGVWANIAAHHQTAKAHANVGAGLGPVTPVVPLQNAVQQGFQNQAANAPQWGPPNGAAGQPGTAPAAWQNAGAPAPQQGWGGGQPQGGAGGQQGPKPRPQWPSVFKINVPFAAKDQFKDFRNQNAQALRGKVAWAGGGDYWIHGDVVGGFQQYNPQPA